MPSACLGAISNVPLLLVQWKKQGGNDYTLLRNCQWNKKTKT